MHDKLKNIFKIYQHHFHSLGSEDTWLQYLSPHFMSDPSKRQQTTGMLATTRIHDEMDEPFQVGLRNAHYVEVKGIIVLIVYKNKYMTNIIFTFYVFL